jgi:hypothetical protein
VRRTTTTAVPLSPTAPTTSRLTRSMTTQSATSAPTPPRGHRQLVRPARAIPSGGRSRAAARPHPRATPSTSGPSPSARHHRRGSHRPTPTGRMPATGARSGTCLFDALAICWSARGFVVEASAAGRCQTCAKRTKADVAARTAQHRTIGHRGRGGCGCSRTPAVGAIADRMTIRRGTPRVHCGRQRTRSSVPTWPSPRHAREVRPGCGS